MTLLKTRMLDEVEVVRGFLRSFNQIVNADFWARADDPATAPRPSSVIVRTDNEEVIGGTLAETSMSWLKIQIMAVHEEYRRKGFGALMLARAEDEARCRGCKYAFLDTMDYQAPDFYRSNGYEVAGSIPDWDSHGHTKLYFTKCL